MSKKVKLKAPVSGVTLIKKVDTVVSGAQETEDDFAGLYDVTASAGGTAIQPTYDFKALQNLVATNNALGSCISAMEVNIDGTGYDISLDQPTPPTEAEKDRIEAVEIFFKTPYPNTSFTTIRRLLRRDLESVGNAYLEIIRNAAGVLLFIKRVDPTTMRLVKLGDIIPTRRSVIRGGKPFEVTLGERPRKYIQKINNSVTYFKDYGINTALDRSKGTWGSDKNNLAYPDRASEIIHFTVSEDPATPYGLPRWISQIPSVVGSRSAEEYNLEYFDNGGVPPVIITVSGGVMASESKTELEAILKGTAKSKLRGAIIETHSVGGDLSSTSKVDVKVERFGTENASDSMFEGYDAKCEQRVRSSFRLPPLFVGKADDYSYATAYASYSIGEAQVFRPERFEFDEIINKTIMQELDPELVFKSKPLTIDNSDVQLKAIDTAAKHSLAPPEEILDTLNAVANLEMDFNTDGVTVETTDSPADSDTVEGSTSDNTIAQGKTPTQTLKSDKRLDSMALSWIQAHGWDGSIGSSVDVTFLKHNVSMLAPLEKSAFHRLVAEGIFDNLTNDPEGISELCDCAADLQG